VKEGNEEDYEWNMKGGERRFLDKGKRKV